MEAKKKSDPYVVFLVRLIVLGLGIGLIYLVYLFMFGEEMAKQDEMLRNLPHVRQIK
jgi:hypothetical protein